MKKGSDAASKKLGSTVVPPAEKAAEGGVEKGVDKAAESMGIKSALSGARPVS